LTPFSAVVSYQEIEDLMIEGRERNWSGLWGGILLTFSSLLLFSLPALSFFFLPFITLSRVADLDLDPLELLDQDLVALSPDPYSKYGSGSRCCKLKLY
jgi:hypothetical protein